MNICFSYMYIFRKRHNSNWNISAHQRSHSFYSVLLESSRFVRLLPENLPTGDHENLGVFCGILFSVPCSVRKFGIFRLSKHFLIEPVARFGRKTGVLRWLDPYVSRRVRCTCNADINLCVIYHVSKLRRIVVGLTRDILQNMCVHTCSSQANCLTKQTTDGKIASNIPQQSETNVLTVWILFTFRYTTSLKLTWPLNIGHPKKKLVFQPSICRCELLISGSVYIYMYIPRTPMTSIFEGQQPPQKTRPFF